MDSGLQLRTNTTTFLVALARGLVLAPPTQGYAYAHACFSLYNTTKPTGTRATNLHNPSKALTSPALTSAQTEA